MEETENKVAYRTSEAARIIGVSAVTIERACRAGNIPSIFYGKKRRILAEVVEKVRREGFRTAPASITEAR